MRKHRLSFSMSNLFLIEITCSLSIPVLFTVTWLLLRKGRFYSSLYADQLYCGKKNISDSLSVYLIISSAVLYLNCCFLSVGFSKETSFTTVSSLDWFSLVRHIKSENRHEMLSVSWRRDTQRSFIIHQEINGRRGKVKSSVETIQNKPIPWRYLMESWKCKLTLFLTFFLVDQRLSCR
jgi:hypothetical protein